MLKQVLSLVSFTSGDHWVFLDLDFSPEGFKAKNLVVLKKCGLVIEIPSFRNRGALFWGSNG